MAEHEFFLYEGEADSVPRLWPRPITPRKTTPAISVRAKAHQHVEAYAPVAKPPHDDRASFTISPMKITALKRPAHYAIRRGVPPRRLAGKVSPVPPTRPQHTYYNRVYSRDSLDLAMRNAATTNFSSGLFQDLTKPTPRKYRYFDDSEGIRKASKPSAHLT